MIDDLYDDLDHAKAVVRSAGYSMVTQRFIALFSDFIMDWKKGDFELPEYAALDVQSCFEAWQEDANVEAIAAQPASELDALRADAARYRWLRNEAYECVVPHGNTVLGKRTGWITKIHPGISYDDAIDAAIKETT